VLLRQREQVQQAGQLVAVLVKPAASLLRQVFMYQGLLDASANFLNCQLTLPM